MATVRINLADAIYPLRLRIEKGGRYYNAPLSLCQLLKTAGSGFLIEL